MSNYVWLCDYTDFSIADTYNIVIQKNLIDANIFILKKKCNHLDSKELIDFDNLYKSEDEFFDYWKNYQFISFPPKNSSQKNFLSVWLCFAV